MSDLATRSERARNTVLGHVLSVVEQKGAEMGSDDLARSLNLMYLAQGLHGAYCNLVEDPASPKIQLGGF